MNIKELIFLIIIFILLYLSFPFIMDWFIVANDFPSNIDNSQWVAFLGSYTGSFISMLGIIITLRFTYAQNKLNNELKSRPYCLVHFSDNEKKILQGKKALGTHYMGLCERTDNKNESYLGVLSIKNVGLGPALQCRFTIKAPDEIAIMTTLSANNPEIKVEAMKALESKEDGVFYIFMEYDSNYSNSNNRINNNNKVESFQLNIELTYNDLFMIEYYQEIVLNVCSGIMWKDDEPPKTTYSIVLCEVSEPKKRKSRC